MRVVVLGTVCVVDAPAAVPTGEIARRVLAVLAAEANRPVHPDRLADLVWPGGQRRGGNSLQAHISRWRKALGGHRITYSPAGYTLVLGPDELDALGFERLARAAVAARGRGDLETGLVRCEQALALWQGPAFTSLADDDCVRGRRRELETLHAEVRLGRLEMLCESGEYDRVVHEAVALAEVDPWNEPVHRVLARAHYGRGEQVAALAVLADLEEGLRRHLGLDLGTSSQLLREQVLRHEPALELVRGAAVEGAVGPMGSSVAIAAGADPRSRLADRVAGLPEPTQRIVCTAALSGPGVDTAHIGRVLGLTGPALADGLTPALTAGILVRDDEGIRFTGPGVRDAVAALVPAGAALDLHRRLGEDLVARRDDAETARRAADHLAVAAPVDAATALRAVDLDRQLARTALSQGRYDEAVVLARRALVSAGHVPDAHARRPDRAVLRLLVAESLHRAGDLESAMTSYLDAGQTAEASAETLLRSALAHEECSLHARRHRGAVHDPSVELIERALGVVAPDHPGHVELLASLAQALAFSGRTERAAGLADAAVLEARRSGDGERLARTLLRCLAVQDPVADTEVRSELAREAAEVSRGADADELELEALSAWVPELMRAGRSAETERVIARVAQLSDLQGNVLHRFRVPMWRAALALSARRHDEAEVLIEDFRRAGERDGYRDTARVHGFQSILLCLGRGEPEQAAQVLAGFEHDRAFEPWRAARLIVAHALGDREQVEKLLVPWSAQRFVLSRPFAGVQVFCAFLIAGAVAEAGDTVARQRLAALLRPGVGRNQVLGAGAAVLGDAAQALLLLGTTGDDSGEPGTLGVGPGTGSVRMDLWPRA